MKAFRINLKAFLGLGLPNQYCHIVMQGILAGFKVNFLVVRPHNLRHPYYEPLLWFMIYMLGFNYSVLGFNYHILQFFYFYVWL